MKKILTILFFHISIVGAGQVIFQKRFGGNTPGWLYSAIQTSDGQYAFTGTVGWGSSQDVVLFKIDTLGNLIWSKTYNSGLEEERGYYLEETTDGGFIISGYGSSQTILGDLSIFIKTNSSGDTLWTHYYSYVPGTGSFAHQDFDGGYFAYGVSNDSINSKPDPCLSKFDLNGNLIWTKSYPENNYQLINSGQQTFDKGYILFGSSDTNGSSSDYVSCVIKTDSNGTFSWSKKYKLGNNDGANFGIQTSDTGYVFICSTYAVGTEIAYLVKTDSLGNILWSKSYDGGKYIHLKDVRQTTDQGYIMVGETNSFTPDSIDAIILIKTDPLGNILWSKTYDDGLLENYGNSVFQVSDGGFILAGQTNTPLTLGDIIKTDSLGNSGCNEHIVNPITISVLPAVTNSYFNDSTLTPIPVYAPVMIANIGSVTTLCFNVGIDSETKNLQAFISVFPNPFHYSSRFLHIIKSGKQNLSLRIYDCMGSLIRKDDVKNPDSFILYRDGLSDGLYLFELISENSEMYGTGKFIVD